MTIAEMMAHYWESELSPECQLSREETLLKLIHIAAEKTREECQKQVDQELTGIMITHPWMTLPDIRDNYWEDEEWQS